MTWLDFEGFEHVDLIESYVLSWRYSNCCLCFYLDVVLCLGHAQYEPPRSNEWACYKQGQLVFANCQSIAGLRPMSEVCPAVDASGERDYDHINVLRQINDGEYAISGEFGNVVLKSDPPILTIATPVDSTGRLGNLEG